MTLFVSLLIFNVFSIAHAASGCTFASLDPSLCPPAPLSPSDFSEPLCHRVESGTGVCRAVNQVEGMEGSYSIANCPSSFGNYNLFHYDCTETTQVPTSAPNAISESSGNSHGSTQNTSGPGPFVLLAVISLGMGVIFLFVYIARLVNNARKKKQEELEQAGNKVQVVVDGALHNLDTLPTLATAPPSYDDVEVAGIYMNVDSVKSPLDNRPPNYSDIDRA